MSKTLTPTSKIVKTKGKTYRKANIALGLSALGLALAYPFQSNFWGGFLTSGCSAALVGGLADWFAVNALFRRPLGVPAGRVFRTEIIPRNRERIFLALRSMVENELLSHEAIKNKVETYDFSAPAIDIWENLDKDSFENILTQSIKHIQASLHHRDKDLEKETLAFLEQESIRDDRVLPLMGKTFLLLLEGPEGKKLSAALLKSCSHWVLDTEVHLLLSKWSERSIQRYISQNPSRRLLALFLPEPAQLAHNLQNQLADYLLDEKTNTAVLEWLKHQVNHNHNPSPNLSGSLELGSLLYTKLTESITTNLMQKLVEPDSAHTIGMQLLQGIDEGVLKLSASIEARQTFNRYVQGVLLPLLENKHQKIGEIVYEGLQKYSNEQLVELIESKAGDDLQMIRINGSVVGGLAGMLIYLVSIILV